MLLLKLQLLLIGTCLAQQEEDIFPVRPPAATLCEGPGESGVCPSIDSLNQMKTNIKEELRSLLNNIAIPTLQSQPVCPCGGAGAWRRIAHLDMRDPNQQCPPS